MPPVEEVEVGDLEAVLAVQQHARRAHEAVGEDVPTPLSYFKPNGKNLRLKREGTIILNLAEGDV